VGSRKYRRRKGYREGVERAKEGINVGLGLDDYYLIIKRNAVVNIL
jgi:hypothetical protein